MTVIDIVEFEIGSERYALDITLTREIVEMVPITPVPRAPAHIAGIINLRGEITNIINLNKILDLPETS
ncbi:MAG: chemotaxis protein CheW, partial [Methanomicrobium sp.]|nr:chemotaxis protein CheW [Methanomicrobium sp.]